MPASSSPLTIPKLPPGKPIDAYILIRQLIHLLTTFLNTVQCTHLHPSGRGILQKNLMFRYSSEANIIVACATELVSYYTSNIDLGQYSSGSTTTIHNAWNLSTSFPAFARVLSLTHGNAEVLFGKPFSRRFHTSTGQQEQHEEGMIKKQQLYRPPAELAPSQAEHERISSALSAQYAIWNNAIINLHANFNPLMPQDAVTLLTHTALTLRTAALAAIKLVEHDLRVAWGLRPIVGTLEAKLVYLAIVKEGGKENDFETRLRRELSDAYREAKVSWSELAKRELEEGDSEEVMRPEWLERLSSGRA
ncbi:hypothetical protein HOY82DRAFT_554405 [Tuber indicum]|nr:hypothetical protein HOY82DRAFT_554405 [Tuber indicum]